jgi:formylglycine-generating enzyme required for sulfatase activity
MRKKLLIALLMASLPIIGFAQCAGEQVKRPIKKQQTTTNTPLKKEQAPSKQLNEEKPAKQKPVEQPSMVLKPSSDIIVQRLINNMVYVEGGTFTMGATSEQGSDAVSDEITHQVTISSFYIGKYEVTQEEWEAVMGNNPSIFKGAKKPVENISWIDCHQFIRKLNSLTGKNFRMLTEAEWEYAARGGQKSKGYKYSGSNILDEVGWYDRNSSKITHVVGLLKPNELGVYDMSGNVREWCSDWYSSYKSNTRNPSGPSSGSARVGRGGGWNYIARSCRVSFRDFNSPNTSLSDFGLRLAL